MYPYFISDILDDDVVMTIEKKDRVTKLILFDDFSCFDEGVYIGPISEETIATVPKFFLYISPFPFKRLDSLRTL